MRALCRDKWNPSKWSFVCIKHFKETDYVTPPGLLSPRLKSIAVPSISDCNMVFSHDVTSLQHLKLRHLGGQGFCRCM